MKLAVPTQDSHLCQIPVVGGVLQRTPGTNDMPLKGEKESDRGEKRHLGGTNPTVSKKRKEMLRLQLVIEHNAISHNTGMSDKEREEK